MARGSIRKRGTTWGYLVDNGKHPDGRRRWATKSGFRTRREAELALREVLREVDDGGYTPPSTVTFGEFVEEWLPAYALLVRPGTLSHAERIVRTRFVPAFGGIRLRDLTAARISAFYARLLVDGRVDGRGSLHPKTVQNTHALLHRFLRDAVRWGLLSRNPADLVDPPRAPATEMRIWTAEQVRTFLAHVRDDPLYPTFVLAASTGMRRGEVLGLRWADVDLDQGRLAVRQTLLGDNGLYFAEPKTRKSRRVIALDAHTVAVLRAHRAAQARQRLAMGDAWSDLDLVTTRGDGNPLHPARFSKLFLAYATQTGLPRIRLHDLRHSAASMLLVAGVHPKVVSERLGHSATGVTMDTYSHVIPALDEGAADAVGDAIFG